MPTAILRNESTLTDRYQTTIPEAIRRVLGLEKRDKIQYEVGADGRVVLSKVKTVEEEIEDPVITAFLAFLEKDMGKHPERIKPMSAKLLEEAIELAKEIDVDIDLDAPLDGDD